MDNLMIISNISSQLKSVCEKIATLTTGIGTVGEQYEALTAVYEELLLDEVHHAQVLTLEMTRATIGQDTNTDEGSVFAEGELNSVNEEQEKAEEQTSDSE